MFITDYTTNQRVTKFSPPDQIQLVREIVQFTLHFPSFETPRASEVDIEFQNLSVICEVESRLTNFSLEVRNQHVMEEPQRRRFSELFDCKIFVRLLQFHKKIRY